MSPPAASSSTGRLSLSLSLSLSLNPNPNPNPNPNVYSVIDDLLKMATGDKKKKA